VLAATLFAAASHAIGGGEVAPLALLVTVVLALPLCVALAGRLGSLWRLSLAVAASQFLYHWCFSALGSSVPGSSALGSSAPGSSALGAVPAGPHAAHLGGLIPMPRLATAAGAAEAFGAAEAAMWGAHAIAAVLTIALLHRGERAALGLARLIGRALPLALPRAVAVPERATVRPVSAPSRFGARLTALSAISHRGPPALRASAT
jgi:hypothetical protein